MFPTEGWDHQGTRLGVKFHFEFVERVSEAS